MSTNIVRSGLRAFLCGSLSIAALSMAAPTLAADLETPFVKAPVRGETRMFVEGGAFWTGGDAIQFGNGDPFFGGKILRNDRFPPNGEFPPCNGLAPAAAPLAGIVVGNGNGLCDGGRPDPSVRPGIGVDGAAGFDHRFAGTRWHVNGEGRAGVSWGTESFTDTFNISGGTGLNSLAFSATATTEAKLTEWHWHADLGMGYDVISGRAPLQIKFGLRVAEVAAITKTTTNAAFNVQFPIGTTVVTATTNDLFTERRTFLGAGPRIGMEGEVPLWWGWTLDYKGDAAVLFGNTKIQSDSVTSFSLVAPTVPLSISATTNGDNFHWSKQIYVWNFDLQAGIGYWITPSMKVALSYRVDVFLDPLRQLPDDTLPGRSIDRYYHGPKLTLVGRWW